MEKSQSWSNGISNMSILAQAQIMYDQCGHPSMTAELTKYLAHGCVFVTPEIYFVLKPVSRNSEVKPADQWNVEKPDAWYIHAIIGNVKKAISLIPYELPWVGWERGLKKRKLKWFNMQSLLRRK